MLVTLLIKCNLFIMKLKRYAVTHYSTNDCIGYENERFNYVIQFFTTEQSASLGGHICMCL